LEGHHGIELFTNYQTAVRWAVDQRGKGVIYYPIEIMRKSIHPDNYRLVAFKDLNDDTTFVTRSTVLTDETIDIDGTTYPLVKVHISSSSHPFFTGEERILDVEGRVDKFKARAAAGEASKEKRANAAQKQAKRQVAKEDKSLRQLLTKSLSLKI